MTRLTLQSAGLVPAPKRRGGTHRKRRERRPLPGMLLFSGRLDAPLDRRPRPRSRPGGHAGRCDGRDLLGHLMEEEGAAWSFRGPHETIAGHGLFHAFEGVGILCSEEQ